MSSYIGKNSDGFGILRKYRWVASGSETSIAPTLADSNGKLLRFTDKNLVHLFLNGVKLDQTDFNLDTANQISGLSALAANDVLEAHVYDVFSIATTDTVSATDGGTFTGAVTHTGAFTSKGIDDNADATAITINSSEQVGIGTTNPSHDLEIKRTAPEIMLEETSSGGSKRLSLGVTSGGLPFINAEQSGGVIAMNMTGTEVARFNSNGLSFPSGKGIDFSATADGTSTSRAEILDDYEEGVWTPTLENGGSVSVSNARYTKIGQQVYAGAYITVSSIPNNSDGFDIGNLPFTVADGSAYHGGGSVTYSGSFNWNNTGAIGAATPYATYPRLYFHRGDGSSATVKNNAVQGLQYFIFSTVYITNS